MSKKIVIITGTRADYGKLKKIIKNIDDSEAFSAYVFVSGMHVVERYGYTYKDIIEDNYKNIHIAFDLCEYNDTCDALGKTILYFSKYVDEIKPDLILVHGDRIDALAGAIVGALKNIIVAHIEGGEVSGTIDDSIRHAITKFAHIHFVSNDDAKKRVMQLGENENSIYVIGSPDIDVMLDKKLPSIVDAKNMYNINFDKYAILIYHPVTTEYDMISGHSNELINALIESRKKYIVILPNNDYGSDIIIDNYKKIINNPRFKLLPSIRFEYFLTILKNAEFIIGNSSAGIREACVYGVPAIDIGTRQKGRYSAEVIKNIIHVDEKKDLLLNAISNVEKYKYTTSEFGNGDSGEKFLHILKNPEFWNVLIQKHFVDIDFNWSGDYYV